jgi:hypothetical protein
MENVAEIIRTTMAAFPHRTPVPFQRARPLSRCSELAPRFAVGSLGSTQRNGYGHKYHL